MTATIVRPPNWPTPAQRLEDAKDALRMPLVKVLDWIAERPEGVAVLDLIPVVTAHVQHEVTAAEIDKALAANDTYHSALRNGRTAGEVLDRLEREMFDAFDALIDARFCAACFELIPQDATSIDCPVLGEVFDHDECHGEAHGATFGSRFCSALDER